MKKIVPLLLIFGIFSSICVYCKKDSNSIVSKSLGLQNNSLKANYSTEIGACFFLASNDTSFTINDNVTYQTLGNSNRDHLRNGCDSAKLPIIDFGNYTLLGQRTVCLMCDSVIKNVVADTLSKKYVYTIIIKSPSKILCPQVARMSLNWATVPKLPKGYKVEFKIINQ